MRESPKDYAARMERVASIDLGRARRYREAADEANSIAEEAEALA